MCRVSICGRCTPAVIGACPTPLASIKRWPQEIDQSGDTIAPSLPTWRRRLPKRPFSWSTSAALRALAPGACLVVPRRSAGIFGSEYAGERWPKSTKPTCRACFAKRDGVVRGRLIRVPVTLVGWRHLASNGQGGIKKDPRTYLTGLIPGEIYTQSSARIKHRPITVEFLSLSIFLSRAGRPGSSFSVLSQSIILLPRIHPSFGPFFAFQESARPCWLITSGSDP